MQNSAFFTNIIMSSNTPAGAVNKAPTEPTDMDDTTIMETRVEPAAAENGSGSGSSGKLANPALSSGASEEGPMKAAASPSSSPAMKPKRRGSALPMKKRKSFLADASQPSSSSSAMPPSPLLAASDIDEQTIENEPAKKKHHRQASPTPHGFALNPHSPVSEEEEACLLSLAAMAAAKNRSFKEQAVEQARELAEAEQRASQDQLTIAVSEKAAKKKKSGKKSKKKKAKEGHMDNKDEAVSAIIQPQINDVLHSSGSSSSSSYFHHIGNRRFRVLVEANLSKYFEEIETEEQWGDLLKVMEEHETKGSLHKPSKVQCQVVDMVIDSVGGNNPRGRFLIEDRQKKDNEEKKEDSEGDDVCWKLASQDEIRSKVHSTFLAAGRFHAKEQIMNAALLIEQQQEEEQLLMQHQAESSMDRSNNSERGEQEDTAEEEQQEESSETDGKYNADDMEVEDSPSTSPTLPSSAADSALAKLAALAEAQRAHVESMKNRSRRTAAVEQAMGMAHRHDVEVPKKKRSESVQAMEEALLSLRAQHQATTAEDKAKLEKAAEMAAELHRRESVPKNEEQVNDMEEALRSLKAREQETAMVAEAKLEKAAKMKDEKIEAEEASKEEVPPTTTTLANLEQALRASAAQQGTTTSAVRRPSAVISAAHTSTKDDEVEFLKMESMRLNALLGRQQQQQAGASLSRLIPTYLPSRNAKKASANNVGSVNGTTTEGAAKISPSTALPSSIDELFSKKDREQATSIEELYACGASSAATSPPSSVGEEGAETATAANKALARATSAPSLSLVCPARIKVFLALPMDRFFVQDTDPIVTTSEYIMPSNYDVLCGPDRSSFFHHVGNRRFRIMIEMNARRYEKAYLASLSGGSNNDDNDAMATEDDSTSSNSIDALIEEMVKSLSKCDPPGRFLGMEMTTGRWRVLNPIYAQLKTEQTFFECLQVEQKRQRAAAVAAAAVVQMEEEEQQQRADVAAAMSFHHAVEREKEILLRELEGRMMGAGLINPQQQQQQQISRSVSQVSLASESCPTGMCPSAYALRNPLPAINDAGNAGSDEDLSLLQSRAKALLRRRQAAEGGMPPQMAGGTDNNNNDNVASMAEIVQRFAREQQHQQSQRNLATRALMMLQQQQQNNSSAATTALPQEVMASRRRSLPVVSTQPLTSLRASFSVGQHDSGGGVFGRSNNGGHSVISSLSSSLSSSRMAKRPSNFSVGSQDSIQSLSQTEATAVAAAAAAMTSRLPQRHHGETNQAPTSLAPSSSNNNNGSGVKDLMDVVGGMMMMSRRGSC